MRENNVKVENLSFPNSLVKSTESLNQSHIRIVYKYIYKRMNQKYTSLKL